MDFVAVVDQVIALLRQRGRVAYRTLKRQFQLDDERPGGPQGRTHLCPSRSRVDEDGRVLVWTGDAAALARHRCRCGATRHRHRSAYTPPYLAEKILTSRSALEGERKQVTVLFADLKGSMELLADRDPEEAQAAPRSRAGTDDGRRASLRRHGQPGAWAMASWRCLARPSPMRTMPCGPAMRPWPCRRPSPLCRGGARHARG